MKNPARSILCCLALTASLSAENLLVNPSFELGPTSWNTFIPAESVAQAPVLEVVKKNARTGTSALRLSTQTSSRFAFGSHPAISVNRGERFRVSAWYRVEPDSYAEDTKPGFLLRINFRSEHAGPETPSQHIYVGPTGVASKNIGPRLIKPNLPDKWTLLEAIVEVPADAHGMTINLFSWGLTGTLWVDDCLVEEVAPGVAATPLG